ncbi:hypothetical protein SUGI_0508890 [Cryptomeria japonica]|nr:hypothetical protein SUGI_0508890 [Cryptomeria japonica]
MVAVWQHSLRIPMRHILCILFGAVEEKNTVEEDLRALQQNYLEGIKVDLKTPGKTNEGWEKSEKVLCPDE